MLNRLIFIVLVIIAAGIGWIFYQKYQVKTAAKENRVELPAPNTKPTSTSSVQGSIDRTSIEAVTSNATDNTVENAIPVATPPSNLDQSDLAAKDAATALSPALSEYLSGDHQIRKWILMIDLLADGQLPNANLPFTFKMNKFAVKTNADETVTFDESNYARVTPFIDAFTSIPPSALAKHYHSWKPLLEQAYAELGKPDTLDSRTRAVIARILAVQTLTTTPELKRPSVYYTFADPELEKADALSKFMWRLGPENQKTIQDYVRQLQPLL